MADQNSNDAINQEVVVVEHPTSEVSKEFAAFTNRAQDFAKASIRDNTKKAYASDWRQFEAWCKSCGCLSMPATPLTVGAYLACLADENKKVSTIQRRLATIAKAHRIANEQEPDFTIEDPTKTEYVKTVLRGIREENRAELTQKKPLTHS